MTPATERAESGHDGEYVPSPLRYVRKQVADYEATAGVRGGLPMFGDTLPTPGRP
jgi:hypothetical protein